MPSFAHIVKDDIALFDHAELIPRDGGHALVGAQCVDGVLQAVVFLPGGSDRAVENRFLFAFLVDLLPKRHQRHRRVNHENQDDELHQKGRLDEFHAVPCPFPNPRGVEISYR